jgi:hypothetical protein
MYMSKSKKPDDVWTKYGVKPFVLDDMNDWMKALNMYRETYEKVEDLNDKIFIRVNLEDVRKEMFELYKEKGEEMGLDSDTAVEFGRDMIRYNKI